MNTVEETVGVWQRYKSGFGKAMSIKDGAKGICSILWCVVLIKLAFETCYTTAI